MDTGLVPEGQAERKGAGSDFKGELFSIERPNNTKKKKTKRGRAPLLVGLTVTEPHKI